MRSQKYIQLSLLTSFVILIGFQTNAVAQLPNGWKSHDKDRPQPKVVTPAATASTAPSDAIVLLGSEKLTGWTDKKGKPTKWKYADGVLESVKRAGYIYSKEKFGDCQLHLEFATPKTVKGDGQGRGNSGVFFYDDDFEVQVLDNFENETYADGTVGALYGQHAPLVNAARGPGEWQTYDIVFRRPRFNKDGSLQSPARLTVLLNGILVQDAAECYGTTSWLKPNAFTDKGDQTRISLQDHGNPVRYRNIWVRRLAETSPTPPTPRPTIELTEQQKKNYIGKFGKVEVADVKGELFATIHRGRPFHLLAHSLTEMSFEKTAGEIEFELDGQGKAISCKGSVDATSSFGGKRNTK